MAFKRNKNFGDMIGGNQECFIRSVNLYCKQLKTCSVFQSSFNKNTFIIRHNVTCKGGWETYIIECCLWNKLQYLGNTEYSLNLRINMHRNDVGEYVAGIFKYEDIISNMLSLLSLIKLKSNHHLVENRQPART